ncbi:MAG: squalene/phytoene synthase family protein [Actinomycetia bacterium]|nr:squalene/phytoene synthase family protein [Actinomycetes bacterium]
MDAVKVAYGQCGAIVRRAGSSFYWGMRLLPPPKRAAVYAVYAWCRVCDDAVDEAEGADAAQRLEAAADLVRVAFGAHWREADHPVAQALGDAVRRFCLPAEPFWELVEGMRMDLVPAVYATFADVRRYCEKVAGTVGRILVEIFGYRDPDARRLAVDMGIALQLTNILRDLREDMARGRLYLPQEDLAAAGLDLQDLASRHPGPAFDRLMALELSRAQAYYARAARLLGLLAEDARLAAGMLYGVYYAIWSQIRAHPRQVLTRRVGLSLPRRMGILGRAVWQAIRS